MAGRRAQSAKQARRDGFARLLGKRAVVTGGNRGIGLAIAKALAGEGCSVMITGRDRPALRKAKAELTAVATGAGSAAEILAEPCDVRDERAVAAVFANVKKRWGGLDVLVNNAGISQARFALTETPVELWRSVIDINLTGTFLCCRAGVPLMGAGATVVNTLSIAAKQTFPEFGAYNASKRGALALTLTLREELIPKGIRVVALLPGATATDIWEQFWPEAPREKMVKPESVADAVVYAVTLPAESNLSELELVPLQGVL